MRLSSVFIVTAFLLAVGAAGTARADNNNAFWGTGIGAAVGSLVGSQFGHSGGNVAATGAGIVAGGVAGNVIGQSIDNDNRARSGSASGYAAPAPMTYHAPSSAPNYVAPPAPPPASAATYLDSDAGTYCREYSQSVMIDGRPQETYGTACLQRDGAWHIVQ